MIYEKLDSRKLFNEELSNVSYLPLMSCSLTMWFSLFACIFSINSSRRLLFPLNNIMSEMTITRDDQSPWTKH